MAFLTLLPAASARTTLLDNGLIRNGCPDLKSSQGMRVCGGMTVLVSLALPNGPYYSIFYPGDKIQYFRTRLASSLHEGRFVLNTVSYASDRGTGST